MSKILEIFGKGITVNVPDVIRHWVSQSIPDEASCISDELLKILDYVANRETIPAKEKIAAYLFENSDCIYGRMTAAAVCLLEGDLKEAINQTQSVYFRQPSNTMALYIMGYCHERLGNTEQAVEFYQDCVKFKQYLQLPHQRMAAIYLREGQVDRAVKEYEALTSEHPGDVSSIILLGNLYLATGSPAQAIDTFNLAILSHPDNFTETLKDDEIASLVQCGMYDEALELVKSTIEQMGLTQDHIVRMGDIYSQWEKDDKAISCYEHAILMQPNSLEATIKLGTHYLRNNRFSLAAEQFNSASQINDEIVDAYVGLATAQKDAGLKDDAIQTLKLASSIQKNSNLLFTEAATLQFQSAVDESNEPAVMSDKDIVTTNNVLLAYREQLKSNKRSDIYHKYGILLIHQEMVNEALMAFEEAIALSPANYRVQHSLAICLTDCGQIEEALEKLAMPAGFGAGIYRQYYQMTMLYTDKSAFAKALNRFSTKKTVACLDDDQIRANIEDMLETLGMIDRGYTSWERINETSACLLEIMGKGDSRNHMSP